MAIGMYNGDTTADHGQDDAAACLDPRVDTWDGDRGRGIPLEQDVVPFVLVLQDIGDDVMIEQRADRGVTEHAFGDEDGSGLGDGGAVVKDGS